MTPRQLRYFVEIARTGSMTTAARTLRIAQPALSQHVALIEAELGTAVFVRQARGVQLTADGRRLLARATSLLQQFDNLRHDITAPPERPRGPVRLCIAGALATVLVAPLFRLVERALPDVRLVLSTAMSFEVRTRLEARQVELALMPNAFELPNLLATPLYEETFHLFGLARLFGEEDGPIRFADIGTRPLVAADRDHDLRRIIERTALALNCPLNVRYELNSPELSLALIRDGLAFAVMPPSAGGAACVPGPQAIRARMIVEPCLTRVQSVVSVADQPLSAAALAVQGALRAVVAQLVDEGLLQGRLLGEDA